MQVNRYALKELREARGLTKSELAVMGGISLPYLCDLESGHRPGSPRVIKDLATALGVSVLAIMVNPNQVAS